MSKTDNAGRNAAVEAIDAEIDATKASLDAAIQDHALRLSGLFARRQVAMLAESLVSGIDGFVGNVLAAQRAPAQAQPEAASATVVPAAPKTRPAAKAPRGKATAKPAAPRSDAGKPAAKAGAKAGSKAPKAEAETPGDTQPKAVKAKGPSRRAKGTAQAEAPVTPTDAGPKTVDQQSRVMEILQAATDPMTPGEIAAAIGIPSRGVGPYLVALTRRKRAVRGTDGRYTAAAAPVTEAA